MVKVLFSFLTTIIAAQCFASPTIDDYGSLPNTSMMSVSPNGNIVAFRDVQNGQDILKVISLSEKKMLPGLNLADIQPKSIRFANDDIVYLQAASFGRVSGFRGKFESSTGFAFNIKTNEIRQLLVPGKDSVYPGQTGLGAVVGFTPKRDSVLMPAFVGTDELILGKPLDPNYSLLKVSVDKRKRPKIEAAGSTDSIDFFVDGDGSLVAEERYDHRNNRHSIWAMKDGALKEIFSETVEIRRKAWVGLTRDLGSLVFLETNRETGRSDYFLLNLRSGKITPSKMGKSDADIEAVVSNNNRVVHGVRYSGFSPSYHFFDPKLDARVKKILAGFPEQSTWIVDQTPDWKSIVVYVEGSSYAGDYYLIGEDNKPVFLTSSRKNIGQEHVNPIGKITITARDGLKVPTLLTIPKSHLADMKNLPAVVYPHGGPRSYDRIEFDYFAQALASQGYMVIQPQFRGSSGFGVEHANAGNGEWGGKMQDDITDTVKSLEQKGIIDPRKVCILGLSYGGYAALAGGAFTPELYQCIVSINGVAQLDDMYQYDKFEHGTYHDSVAFWEKQFAANKEGEIDKAGMKERSPAEHAQNFMAPVMLIHSENDKVVPLKQSSLMKRMLQKHDKQVELVKLDGDNHYLENNDSRRAALEAAINFINAHLRPD